jgi:hypothetical protein
MNKKFSSLLIIAVFLSVQAFSLLHVSKYGFEKHEHNGKNCDICLSADHNKLLSNNTTNLIAPNLLPFKVTLPKATLPFSGKVQNFQARAPPLFS